MRRNARRNIAGLLPALLVPLLQGCPDKVESVHIALLKLPKAKGECNIAPGGSALEENTYDLRVSFLRRKGTTQGTTWTEDPIGPRNLRDYELVCDRVLSKGDDDLEILVPHQQGRTGPAATTYTVVAEAFRKGKLVFVGRREQLDISKPAQNIFLRPSGDISCEYQAVAFRAFHTATLLPNGEVLLLGGLIGEPNRNFKLEPSKETGWATGTAEVYAPDSRGAGSTFRLVDGTIPARAFHVTQLLRSPAGGPYKLLVVGGVQRKDAKPMTPVFSIRFTSGVFPFPVSPHKSAVPGRALLVTYTPSPTGPRLTYKELPGLPAMFFPRAALTSGGDALVVAGGASKYVEGQQAQPTRGFFGQRQAHWIDIRDPASIRVTLSASMKNTRVGHGLVRMGTDRYLAVGGNMDGQDADVAELRTPAAPSAFAPIPLPAGTVTTAFHAFTAIGGTDTDLDQGNFPTRALWSGGLGLASDAPNLRVHDKSVNVPAARLLVDGPSLGISAVPIPAAVFRPAAYHSSTRLHDGSVLLAGGTRPRCEGDKAFCPDSQLTVIRWDGAKATWLGTTQDPSPRLRTARFGHRATRLLDNTVLITGGIEKVKDDLHVIQRVEVFNPRNGSASEDFPFNRSPGQAKKPCVARRGEPADGGP